MITTEHHCPACNSPLHYDIPYGPDLARVYCNWIGCPSYEATAGVHRGITLVEAVAKLNAAVLREVKEGE